MAQESHHAPEPAQRGTISALREAMARIEAEPAEGHHSLSGSSSPSEATDVAGAESSHASDYDAARQVVLRKLTGSAKSRHQLAEALREKEFDEATSSAVLDRMEEVGLIDDAEFARVWVRTRHQTKGLGATALRHELAGRGVAEPLIEEAVAQLSAEDEEAVARELLEKKLGDTVIPAGHNPEDRRERERRSRRLVSMLGRRGHSPSTALRLVREVMEERTA